MVSKFASAITSADCLQEFLQQGRFFSRVVLLRANEATLKSRCELPCSGWKATARFISSWCYNIIQSWPKEECVWGIWCKMQQEKRELIPGNGNHASDIRTHAQDGKRRASGHVQSVVSEESHISPPFSVVVNVWRPCFGRARRTCMPLPPYSLDLLDSSCAPYVNRGQMCALLTARARKHIEASDRKWSQKAPESADLGQIDTSTAFEAVSKYNLHIPQQLVGWKTTPNFLSPAHVDPRWALLSMANQSPLSLWSGQEKHALSLSKC